MGGPGLEQGFGRGVCTGSLPEFFCNPLIGFAKCVRAVLGLANAWFARHDSRLFAISRLEQVGVRGHDKPAQRLRRLVAALAMLLKDRPHLLVIADLGWLLCRLSAEQGRRNED